MQVLSVILHAREFQKHLQVQNGYNKHKPPNFCISYAESFVVYSIYTLQDLGRRHSQIYNYLMSHKANLITCEVTKGCFAFILLNLMHFTNLGIKSGKYL